MKISDLDDIKDNKFLYRKIGSYRLEAYPHPFDEINEVVGVFVNNKTNKILYTLWNMTVIGDKNGYFFCVKPPNHPGDEMFCLIYDRSSDDLIYNKIDLDSNETIARIGFMGEHGEPAIQFGKTIKSLIF